MPEYRIPETCADQVQHNRGLGSSPDAPCALYFSWFPDGSERFGSSLYVRVAGATRAGYPDLSTPIGDYQSSR